MSTKAFPITKLTFWQTWLLHALLVWLVMTLGDALDFFVRTTVDGPYLRQADGSAVTYGQRFLNHNITQAISIVILVVTLLVEGYYHFIFRKYPLAIVVGAALFTGIAGWLFILAFHQWLYGQQQQVIQVEPILFIAAYCGMYAYLREYVYQRVHRAEQRYEQSKAELTALRAQLHPHFFFNTLNTLYGTAFEENASRTAEILAQLSSLLRYVLSEPQADRVALTAELQFIEDYLHLQRLRIPQREHIRIHTAIQYDGKPASITPLLLIPFIENAFQYGISIDKPCFVQLSITAENQQLEMMVKNRLLAGHSGQAGIGTGIENARKRLYLLYPNRHRLEIQASPECHQVRLWIDLS
jgi:hypothetical protein